MEYLLVFIGYLLVTSGVFTIYLILFRKERLPKIFQKWWFSTIIIIIAVCLSTLGWLLATKIIS